MRKDAKKTDSINRPETKPYSAIVPLAPWQSAEGSFTAGSAALHELAAVRIGLEARWGAGRLRMLASADLRERFDRQAVKLNRAERVGTLEELTGECARMRRGWEALEKGALADGHAERPPPDLWEARLPDGRLLVLCRTDGELERQRSVPGRQAWSLEEVARLVAAQDPDLLGLKDRFGGVLKEFVREG